MLRLIEKQSIDMCIASICNLYIHRVKPFFPAPVFTHFFVAAE